MRFGKAGQEKSLFLCLYVRDYSGPSWQPLQATKIVNCDSINNSAREKISFANLIYLSKDAI